MTDLEDIRRDGEEEIVAILAMLDERHQALLRDALRRYGSVANIPQSVWDQIQGDTENELVAVALLLMMGGASYTSGELGSQGVSAPPPGQTGLAKMSLLAARQAQSAAAASVDSLQRRIVHGLEQARLDKNLGNVGDLTQEGIDKALQDAFDEARRKRIAIDETTEAITKGQQEAAGGADKTNIAGQRVTVEMRWQTERDNRVCPRCSPLHETPEEVWSKVFPNGPGRDAHPNCVLPGTRLVPLGKCDAAMKAFYEGPVVEITLASGSQLTITENHLVLIGDEWVPAHAIKVGDNCLRAFDPEGVASTIDPDYQNSPTLIEDVFTSLLMASEMSAVSVPASAEHLHGDGSRISGNIDVVLSNRELLSERNIKLAQHACKMVLQRAGIACRETADCSVAKFGDRGSRAATCDVCGRDLGGPLITRHAGPLDRLSRRLVADFDSSVPKHPGNGESSDACFVRDLLEGLPGGVLSDAVTDVRKYLFSGHVYDLSVEETHATLANGIVTHNCRCWLRAVVVVEDNTEDA
mgnify:FL=1